MDNHKSTFHDEVMLRFMKDNPDLARGFTKGDKDASDAKWAELCNALNGIGPPTKDVEGWKNIWSDWKRSIRKKLAKNKADIRATGGGPSSQLPISDVEEEVAKLCGWYEMLDGVGSPAYGASTSAEHVLAIESEDETEKTAEEPKSLNVDEESKRKRRRTNPAASLDLQSLCETQLDFMTQLYSSMVEHFKKIEDLQKEAVAIQKKDVEIKKKLLNKLNNILRTLER